MFKCLDAEVLGVSGRQGEVIELALSHGFKGLDLDMVDFAEQARTQGLAKAARLITSARLKIGSFRLPVRWTDDSEYKSDLGKLPARTDVAAQIGCTGPTTTIEAASELRPYHENFEFHRQRLAEIADVLRPYHIRLGVGFLAPIACRDGRRFQFMQTCDEVLMLLRSTGPPNVGVALDSWHWHLGGGTLDALRTLSAAKIVTVSLADAESGTIAADARIESRRLNGDSGAVDVRALLVTLAELGYDGPVTPAPDRGQLGASSRDQIVKHAGTALDQLWKAAGLSPGGRLPAASGPIVTPGRA
jgi:sugar phosphate isomerase/epimerase